jgi:hypothetical protein
MSTRACIHSPQVEEQRFTAAAARRFWKEASKALIAVHDALKASEFLILVHLAASAGMSKAVLHTLTSLQRRCRPALEPSWLSVLHAVMFEQIRMYLH